MNYKITLIFLLLAARLYCHNRVDIYLSFNDCVNCYASLTALESISGYEKNIIIYREDSAVSKELLENYTIQKNITYQYISRKAPNYSLCKIFVKDQLVDSFPLTALPEKIKSINNYLLKNAVTQSIKSYLVPGGTVLTKSRLQVAVKENRINVYDYILGKNIVFSFDPSFDTLKKMIELKSAQFPQKTFLQMAKIDTAFYYGCLPEMKKIGKANAHLEQAFLSDSSAFVLLNFPWPYLRQGKDTALNISLFLYEHNFITGKKQLSYIDYSGIKNKYKNRYDVNGSAPFFVDAAAGKISLSLLDFIRPDNDLYILSDFVKKQSGYYAFEKMDEAKFDRNYYTKSKVDSFAVYANSRFYYSIKLKMLIDHEKHKTIQLTNYELPPSSFCIDLLEKNDTLKILVLHKNEIEIVSYDLKTQKAGNGIRRELPADCSVNSMRLYNKNTIAFFNKSSTIFSLMNVSE